MDITDPINSEEAIQLRTKLWKCYTICRVNSLFQNSDILEIKNMKDKKIQTHYLDLVPSFLTAAFLINKATVILEGPPGSGKTSVIEFYTKMLTGLSIKDQEKNILRCQQDMSADQLTGHVDLGKLVSNEHEYDVIWEDWVTDEDNITLMIDEVNLANPSVRAALLSIMAEGVAKHGFRYRRIKDIRILMTMNSAHRLLPTVDSFELDSRFLDRVMIYIPVKQATAPDLEDIEEVRKDDRIYGVEMDDFVKPVMTIEELQEACKLVDNIPVSPTAKKYARYLTRDPNHCIRSMKYDKLLTSGVTPGRGLCDGCHFDGNEYICQEVYGGSTRIYKDLILIAKAFAFWLPLEKVNEYLIQSIAPYVVFHRLHCPEGKLNSPPYYGNKLMYVQEKLINWCFSKLTQRKESEMLFRKMYKGMGDKQNLEKMIKLAANDLYVRLELFSRIAMIDRSSIFPEVSIKQSVLDDRYKEEMNKALTLISTNPRKALINNKILELMSSDFIPFRENILRELYRSFQQSER